MNEATKWSFVDNPSFAAVQAVCMFLQLGSVKCSKCAQCAPCLNILTYLRSRCDNGETEHLPECSSATDDVTQLHAIKIASQNFVVFLCSDIIIIIIIIWTQFNIFSRLRCNTAVLQWRWRWMTKLRSVWTQAVAASRWISATRPCTSVL